MKHKIRALLAQKQKKGEPACSPFRQTIHLMADTGWISDPNGLCQLGDTYHIFHQYTPDESRKLWKSWGHYTTTDWIHFQDIGTLMTPEDPLDRDGCYSGSGLVHEGILHLFYTGNILEEGDYDYINEGRGHYTNHLCSTDGIHFSEKETLLKNEDYPADMSCHVRDPKAGWTDGHLYVTLGARTRNGTGCALLYEASDKNPCDLHFVQTIHSTRKMGYMWECPDLFRLDGQLLLLCCPQGVEQEGIRYENIYQNGWFLLEKQDNGNYIASGFQELDHGFDFYAPQTLTDKNGRRILIGWMAVPDADYAYLEKEDGWIHCLSLPRELHWKNGRIYQYPIAEIQNLRGEETLLRLQPEKPVSLPDSAFELHLETGNSPFEIHLRKDARLLWDGHLFTLALKESGAGRTARHLECEHLATLDIFSDVSSLEIFINGGEYALSTRLYDAGAPFTLSSSRSVSGRLYPLSPLAIDYTQALGGSEEQTLPGACAGGPAASDRMHSSKLL